jgi:hypothetical protein
MVITWAGGVEIDPMDPKLATEEVMYALERPVEFLNTNTKMLRTSAVV